MPNSFSRIYIAYFIVWLYIYPQVSCTTSWEADFLKSIDVNNGMSISFWMKPENQSYMTLLQKTLNGKAIFDLHLLKNQFNFTIITNTSTFEEHLVSLFNSFFLSVNLSLSVKSSLICHP